MYEKTINSKTIYTGRILNLEVQDIEMENGVRSIRELIRHKSAIAVLAMLPDERFVFVRQFRKAIESEILELIAGLKEDDESPEDATRREIREETGYNVDGLMSLGKVYPSPGYTEEYIDLYFAYLAPEQQSQSQDDDERVEVVYMTEDEILIGMQEGSLHDAKLLAAWALYDRLVKNALDFRAPACNCTEDHG